MCWHKWTKWHEVAESKERPQLTLGYGGQHFIPIWYQRRDCEKCGKIQIARIDP